MNFINPEIESYCLKFSSKENKILKKLYRETHHNTKKKSSTYQETCQHIETHVRILRNNDDVL